MYGKTIMNWKRSMLYINNWYIIKQWYITKPIYFLEITDYIIKPLCITKQRHFVWIIHKDSSKRLLSGIFWSIKILWLFPPYLPYNDTERYIFLFYHIWKRKYNERMPYCLKFYWQEKVLSKIILLLCYCEIFCFVMRLNFKYKTLT